jgi:hypothetical protein
MASTTDFPRSRTADARLVAALRRLAEWGERNGWAGTDPYDGLEAMRFTLPLRATTLGRRVLTQAVKRSPVDLRPLLGVPRARSAAALAHVVSAYASGRFLPAEEAEARLANAVDMLLALRCAGFDEPCWGYHFDVQTRVFFYPKGAPNTIATAFAGLALLDAHERTGSAHVLETARDVASFFLDHVPQTEASSGAFFGYLVGDRTPIHNANMLVSAFLARLAAATGEERYAAPARAGVVYTVSHQRADGAWLYGELPHLNWIDNFHTAYVLEALRACAEAGVTEAVPAIELGRAYYRRELFLPDATPKYFPTSLYPIDAQCVAEGIQTFARAGDDESVAFAARIFEAGERALGLGDGRFAFQRTRWWTNRATHVRWVVAPLLLAFTHLHRALEAA